MLSLNGGDLGHCSEDVSTVGGCALHAVAVIDLPLTGFLVHVELGREGSQGLEDQGLRDTRIGSCAQRRV